MRSVTNVLGAVETPDMGAEGEEDDEDQKTEEDLMLEEIRKSGKQSNVSMIAFTATPNNIHNWVCLPG